MKRLHSRVSGLTAAGFIGLLLSSHSASAQRLQNVIVQCKLEFSTSPQTVSGHRYPHRYILHLPHADRSSPHRGRAHRLEDRHEYPASVSAVRDVQ
jgi:hypothetical protein